MESGPETFICMLPIVKLPTASLRERSKEIDTAFLLTPETQQLIQDMIPTMYGDDGIGLAAPQVGQNIRLCIVGKASIPKKHELRAVTADQNKDLILVNPVWKKMSRKMVWDTEGCLSVPKVFGKVQRQKYIAVKALDECGHQLQFTAENFFARVIQHEVDHLDGILFIDKAKDVYRVPDGETMSL